MCLCRSGLGANEIITGTQQHVFSRSWTSRRQFNATLFPLRTVRVWLKRDSGQYWPSIYHVLPCKSSSFLKRYFQQCFCLFFLRKCCKLHMFYPRGGLFAFIRRLFAHFSTVPVLCLGDILILVALLVLFASAKTWRKLQQLTATTLFQQSTETWPHSKPRAALEI